LLALLSSKSIGWIGQGVVSFKAIKGEVALVGDSDGQRDYAKARKWQLIELVTVSSSTLQWETILTRSFLGQKPNKAIAIQIFRSDTIIR
jgi:hypothetical protein